MIYVTPLWLVGLVFCWVPAVISKKRNPDEPVWGWVLFGITCLPLAVVFSLMEKPAGQRRTYADL